MTKRWYAASAAFLALVAGIGANRAAAAPTPHPTPITVPGGLRPAERAAADTGCDAHGVCIVKDTSGRTCQGLTPSNTTPPAQIRVLLTASTTIVTLPFQTYVKDVLPNEWVPSWDGDSLRAGAVAVKSYAWYWVNHFGGDIDHDTSRCFDVTDDTRFQKYVSGSRLLSTSARSDLAVQQTWPVAAVKNGAIFQTQYVNFFTSPSESCGTPSSSYPGEMSQYGSQNCVEANTGNKYNVILQRYYGADLQLATAQQLRTPHDFRYLQTSTPATFNNGLWTIEDGYSPPTTFTFGGSGEIPVITTSGDGFAHIGVFNPPTSIWYLGNATGNVVTKLRFGDRGDVPVAAQYQGATSPTQLAVFRPSTGTWYFATPSGAIASSVSYGAAGDIPIPGDYDGVGHAEVALYRPGATSRFYVYGKPSIAYGTRGDIPIPADYDGNGKLDIAIYRPGNPSRFYIYGRPSIAYGTYGDIPVTGDFTGDGKADIAIYRPSNHSLYVYGLPAQPIAPGTPIGAAPYHD